MKYRSITEVLYVCIQKYYRNTEVSNTEDTCLISVLDSRGVARRQAPPMEVVSKKIKLDVLCWYLFINYRCRCTSIFRSLNVMYSDITVTRYHALSQYFPSELYPEHIVKIKTWMTFQDKLVSPD